MVGDNDLTWRVLNREGCEYGRRLALELERMDERMDECARKLDRMTWALVTTAIGFATAAIMLALNLLL